MGDNLEWDVSAPQRAGIAGIWVDAEREGVAPAPHRPDRVIAGVAQLLEVEG